MRSATSYFNVTLLQKNWKRFWPIWGLYLAVLIFSMPVSLLLNASSLRGHLSGADYTASMVEQMQNQIVGGNVLALCLTAVFSILIAMAVYSYLYNSRSAGGIHSLPIKREGLFLTNYLSGLSFLILPDVVMFLLMLAAGAAAGCADPGNLAMLLGRCCAYAVIFFSLATFCAMLAGHVLALPAFYVVANVLVAGVTMLTENILSAFVFGFQSVSGVTTVAFWCTPVLALLRRCGCDLTYNSTLDRGELVWRGNGAVAIYVAVGIALAVIALLLYRRRQMESAGDVVAVGWMRPVFRYGVAFCCALVFGMFFYFMFSDVVPEGAWSLLAFMLICGAAGYFIASMLLAKSFRVLRKWKGCVVFLAVLAALTCVMELDLTGFERRVPGAEQVEEAYVSRLYTYPYDSGSGGGYGTGDPAVIRLLVEAHRDIVRSKGEIEHADDYDSSNSFAVTYRLKGGALVTRSYRDLPIRLADLEREGSYAALLQQFVNLPEVVRSAYMLDSLEGQSASYAAITLFAPDDGVTRVQVELESTEAQTVWEAVQRDFAEGNLGRRSITGVNPEHELDTDFTLEIRRENKQLGALAGGSAESYTSLRVALTTEAAHTLDALRQVGVLNETQVLRTYDGQVVQ